MNRQAKSQIDHKVRHRINAGRVAIQNQIAFFTRQFGEVISEWKEDDTRVTFADFAISEKVFAELRKDFPADDFCSEEASPLDEEQTLSSPFAWIIDPIDGSNNYALGCPFCAISLALLFNGQPIYGFIYDHSSREILEGGPGYGLFSDQKKIDRDAMVADAQTMIGLHFPMSFKQLEPFADLLAKYRVRCLGSGALTASYVAKGYLTGAIDYRVKVWDIAAAYALCRSVGLTWTFIESSPFPLRTFHPHMDFSPYYAGSAPFMAELVCD